MYRTISDFLESSVADRIQLVEDLWDRIAEVPEALPLTEEDECELDRRLEVHGKSPEAAGPWGDVRGRLIEGR